jgi:signal transduction histidine kinase
MELTEPDLSRAERFEQQILNLLSRQARRVPLPVFICTCMIAGMAWPSIPAHYLISWLVLVLVVLAVRWRILGRISDHTQISIEKRVRIAVTLSAINGCVHGISLLFFPFMPLFECAVQSMILIGMSAGAVVTTAGKSSILLAYAFPTLAVLAGSWAFGSNFADTGWIHWTMALMILVFAYILDAVTRDMGRVLRESFEIRTERAALNRELRAALDIAEAASQSKTRFLASASHDLRQPLQALALFAASLAMRQLDKGSKEIAEHMNTALNDLTSELDALLDISKLDAGVVVPEPTEVDLPALIRRACENFRPSAEIKKHKIHYYQAARIASCLIASCAI